MQTGQLCCTWPSCSPNAHHIEIASLLSRSCSDVLLHWGHDGRTLRCWISWPPSPDWIMRELQGTVLEHQSIPLHTSLHPLQPGNQFTVKSWKDKHLKPRWEEPREVLLIMPTALKVAGLTLWTHHSQVKWQTLPSTPGMNLLKFQSWISKASYTLLIEEIPT